MFGINYSQNFVSTPCGSTRKFRCSRTPCQCSTHERRATLTGLLRLSPITGCIQTEENVLLRKEVIQPHLPVRLPCYDFVPITSPTFDSSLPYGLGHRLRVLPTFVT